MRVGFMWHCPWRIEWARPFEYWYRYQCGPFFVLKGRPETPEDASDTDIEVGDE